MRFTNGKCFLEAMKSYHIVCRKSA